MIVYTQNTDFYNANSKAYFEWYTDYLKVPLMAMHGEKNPLLAAMEHLAASETESFGWYVHPDTIMLYGAGLPEPSHFSARESVQADTAYQAWLGKTGNASQVPAVSLTSVVFSQETAKLVLEKALSFVPLEDSTDFDSWFNLLVNSLLIRNSSLPREYAAIISSEFAERGLVMTITDTENRKSLFDLYKEEPVSSRIYNHFGMIHMRDHHWDRGIFEEVVNGDAYAIKPFIPRGLGQNPLRPVHDLKHVIDVGANAGFFSAYIKRIWPNAFVDAIEPYPPNIYFLEKNLSKYGNYEIHPNVALDDEEMHQFYSWRYFSAVSKNNGGGSAVVDSDKHPDFEVRAIKVSSLIGDDDVDILKMDCEGGELYILRDLDAADKLKNIKWIRMEYHDPAQVDEMRKILTKTHAMSFSKAKGSNTLGYAIGHRK